MIASILAQADPGAFDLGGMASAFSSLVWGPWLLFLLLGCGLLFSVITKMVQWRVLTHGYACIRGRYDDPNDTGQINHFQALCAALSATIGLGNIAGVAIAVSLGGPGAIFWMWVVGVLGMALKFAECSLAVMFRDVRDVPDPSAPALMESDAEDRTLEYAGQTAPKDGATPKARGEVRGGPMWYMQKALVEPFRARGNPFWVVFKVLAILFAISTMLNSFGGGNMFQGWNVADMLDTHFAVPPIASASVVSVLVALVIIGGIKRIGQVASKLVPLMCVIYVAGALYFIGHHVAEIPRVLAMIVTAAFTPTAELGGFAGASVWVAFTWGLKRACFSNEAGEGSAAMAHAAAKTDEPIREGVVAGIGPFIDTIIICTISALVILMSGAWNRPAVGTITSIDGDRAIITCTPKLPANLEPLYIESLQKKDGKLSVHLVRGADKKAVAVKLPIVSIEGIDGASWADLNLITLDLSKVKKKNRALLAIAQPAHLDIEGAALTGFAFDTCVHGFGKYIVTLGVCLFAFSTMISWSYYGEKGAEFLLGPQAILPYKFIFVVFVFLGMTLDRFDTIYAFSDATTGLMVLCNLPAILLLSPVVVRAARDYFRRLDAGEMPRRS